MAVRDPYDVLGVGREAGPEAIKRAYRRLLLELHPDTASEPSTERFRSVREAYEVLSDPVRRRLYDQRMARERIEPRHPSATAPPQRQRAPLDPLGEPFSHPAPLDEFFDLLMSDFAGFDPASAAFARRVGMEIVLSPEEARTGGRLPINLPMGERIWLDIPPGVRGGERRKVQVTGAGIDNVVLDIRLEVS